MIATMIPCGIGTIIILSFVWWWLYDNKKHNKMLKKAAKEREEHRKIKQFDEAIKLRKSSLEKDVTKNWKKTREKKIKKNNWDMLHF